jgi:AAA+ superfamily predicted ATPase
VFENYKKYIDGAKRQAYKSKTEFSWDKMKEKLNEILETNLPLIPLEVKLKFPKLNKIELPKKETING